MRAFHLVFTLLAAATSAHAVNFSAGFDAPEFSIDNETDDVAGQNGWVIDDPTPDLSFFVNWGYLGSEEGNQGAAVGAYLDSPVNDRVELAHAYGGRLVDSLATLKFAVQPSTPEYPGADSFGWSYRDAGNTSLLTISLEPNLSFSDRMEVVWYNAANVRTETGYDLFYNSAYDLAIAFTGSGPDAVFSASITGTETLPFSGTLSSLSESTLQSIGASITRDPNSAEYGDNFFVFDALSIQAVVPEPATGLLALAGLISGVCRRRR